MEPSAWDVLTGGLGPGFVGGLGLGKATSEHMEPSGWEVFNGGLGPEKA